MAKNVKSVLMTPDPYHTPGYGGYCPQFKYQFGNTFGRTTSDLLQNDQVPSSGNLVLTDIYPKPEDQDVMLKKNDKLKDRTQSWGDQKLLGAMVPGYTGFIPKCEHYYGKRYAENCVNAITSFEADQNDYKQKMRELKTIEEMQMGKDSEKIATRPLPKILTRRTLPLSPVDHNWRSNSYISKSKPKTAASPYTMAQKDPKEFFMSGYTGFVPRSRGLYGQGFPIVTNKALVDFGEVLAQQEQIRRQPVNIERPAIEKSNSTIIYPIESGLVPKYTGHIPGEKFRYGQTFGLSTVNALKEKKHCQMV